MGTFAVTCIIQEAYAHWYCLSILYVNPHITPRTELIINFALKSILVGCVKQDVFFVSKKESLSLNMMTFTLRSDQFIVFIVCL